MAINKVVFGNNTLIDLTGDTLTAADLLSGKTAHDKSGESITGTCTFDSDTSDATAAAGDILSGQTVYARGAKVTGSMSNNGQVNGSITTVDQEFSIVAGYHDGSGKVAIDEDEQAKIIAANIKNGVEILGVTGTLSPAEDVTSQKKTVTPKTTAQVILPDDGVDYLSEVDVNAIAYAEVDNAAGGKTATIGTV